jgi:hypothetical protein
MSNFATLKKSSVSLDRLTKELEKITTPVEKQNDDRFWSPEVDKAGNGAAIIRFLPAPAVDGDDALPWVRIFNHGFKGPTGKWYIENSLTTLGQKDPVSEYNTQLWNSSTEDNSSARKQARDQKRRLTYISNIMVLSDPKHPDNEGKVFLYRYGKKIFDKITLLMNPEFEGDDPVNPFDFWKGANFKMRIRTVEGYRNYDMSQFEASSPVNMDDSKLEELWKREYSLKEFLDPKNFKSYDDLKRKMEDVLEINSFMSERKSEPSSKTAPTAPKQVMTNSDNWSEDDDEDLRAFKALADD